MDKQISHDDTIRFETKCIILKNLVWTLNDLESYKYKKTIVNKGIK